MKTSKNTNLVSDKDKTGIVNAGINHQEIRIKGTPKAQRAIREFSRYGLITFSREQTFKSSTYSFHFIKPVAKLKQLYNLGDEVLILCCNDSLTNFKSRTKDFIDYILVTQSEFKNRLDKVTCFIVDDCDDVEGIIKLDRIESPDSRLIVPFSYLELEQGLNDEKLQNRLRMFLYERDLFGIASPLKDENLFFGKDRTNAISELYGKYRQGEHGGLFGLRRIGKTSVLNLLRYRVEQNKGVVVYFDCSKYHHQRWNLFLKHIILSIKEKYAYNESEDQICLPEDFTLVVEELKYSESEAAINFEMDLASLYKALGERRILLIFDEIEQISYTTSPSEHWRGGNDALFFWQTLRAISQTNSSLFSFVITGVNPKCIEMSKINSYDNPIFNVLSPQYISLFDLDDVKNMVTNIGGHVGLQFEEEIFTKLIDDYGGHPFLTRQVCSKINADVLERGEERPYTVSKYSYERHSKDYKSKMEAVIEQILGVLQDYYPTEYELLKILALDGNTKFKRSLHSVENPIPHLLGYCLIQKDQDDYYIRIRSIEEYIRLKYHYDKTLSTNAEKLARISQRRNAIEEKLRRIMLHQFNLKFGKKSKEKLIEFLRKTTPDTSQEGRLQQSKNLKEAMECVYFSQLKGLMLKDWVSYQTLFSDKMKFEQFFDIINKYRADAHGKTIDEEDEALLNIAFKFFENALENI